MYLVLSLNNECYGILSCVNTYPVTQPIFAAIRVVDVPPRMSYVVRGSWANVMEAPS